MLPWRAEHGQDVLPWLREARPALLLLLLLPLEAARAWEREQSCLGH